MQRTDPDKKWQIKSRHMAGYLLLRVWRSSHQKGPDPDIWWLKSDEITCFSHVKKVPHRLLVLIRVTSHREYLSSRGAILREHHTGQNKWDSNFGVASLTTLFHGWEDDNALIEFPSTHASEGIKTLIEQLVTWYPDAPKSQKTDTVMAFWFAELACRDRVSNARTFARSHSSLSMFHTPYDRARQYTVQLDEAYS